MSWPYGDPPEPLVAPPSSVPTWQCPGEKCECHAVVEGGDEVELPIVLLAHDGARMPGARCRVHHQGRVLNEDAPNADGDGRIKVKLPRKPTQLFLEWAPPDTPLTPGYPYRAHYYAHLGDEPRQVGRRRLANLGFWTERTLEDNVRTFQRRYGHRVATGKLEDIEAQLALFHDTGCPPVTHDEPAPPGPSLGKGDLGGAKGFGLVPGDQNAKRGPEKDPNPLPPSAQPPLDPAQDQGSIKVPSPGVEVDLIVDWGRGRKGVAGTTSKSFWVRPSKPPVFISVPDAGPPDWVTDRATYVAVSSPTETTSVATLPPGEVLIKLEVDLMADIGSMSRSVLAFYQLFILRANGDLVPYRFAFADYGYAKGSPPTRAKGTGRRLIAGDHREGIGLHPLLSTGPDLVPPSSTGGKPAKGAVARRTKQLFVNAEFVDATDLWWDLHNLGDAPQYLTAALGARSDHLRVLAWTTGDLPMIWFAAVPDAALADTEGKGADLVFFRPMAGANSFTHKADASGFADTRHHTPAPDSRMVSTLWMLARFLVSPQTVATLTAAGATPSMLDALADRIQPRIARDEAGVVTPAGPAPYISDFNPAFRACAFERSLNAAGAPNVLFLPLCSRDVAYGAAIHRGLKQVMEAAFMCLWNQCAVARDLPASRISPDLFGPEPPMPQFPTVAARQLWLAGHSAGNFSTAAALNFNPTDVDRVLSFAAPTDPDALSSVIGALRSAAPQRAKISKTLDAFIISGPDLTKTWTTSPAGTGYKDSTTTRGVSMDVPTARRFMDTGARVTFLPAYAMQLTHFTIRPVTSMNPILRNLLGVWTDAEVDASADNPVDWQFLFFHEYAVHGGDGTPDAPNPFFLQALGPPMPLTAAPTALPP